MSPAERVPYDEFAYFHENADEFGIPYDGPPTVRRERVPVDDDRALSALVWGEAEPELVLLHGGAQNAHTWDTVALALDRPLRRTWAAPPALRMMHRRRSGTSLKRSPRYLRRPSAPNGLAQPVLEEDRM
jgi:pimeloyl-ACP methyl ester carboxylesterase